MGDAGGLFQDPLLDGLLGAGREVPGVFVVLTVVLPLQHVLLLLVDVEVDRGQALGRDLEGDGWDQHGGEEHPVPELVAGRVGVQLDRVVAVQPDELGDVEGLQVLRVLEDETSPRNGTLDLNKKRGPLTS